MAESEDKRIKRTKKLLRQALQELMQEKAFQDITVTDLVERADINRGTFYVHYRDVYDLRERIENQMIEDFRVIIAAHMPSCTGRSLRPMLERAAEYVEQHRDIVSSLLSTSGTHSFEAKMTAVIEEARAAVAPVRGLRQEYDARFVSAGMMSVMEKWLADERRPPRDEVVEFLDALLTRNLPE